MQPESSGEAASPDVHFPVPVIPVDGEAPR